MARWVGNSIDDFKKYFKSDVTFGAGLSVKTSAIGEGDSASYVFLVGTPGGVVKHRALTSIKEDVGDASTSNKGVASFSSDNFSVSSAHVTIKSGGVDLTDEVTGALPTANIADDAVTFAKASGVTPNVYGSVIKLIPSDFMANDDGGNTKFGVGYVEGAGAGYGMRPANSLVELFAFVSIPEGMKATHVHIYAKGTYSTEVFEAQIDATTMSSKGTGNCNTNLALSSEVESSATNFLAISVNTTATTDKVYGGIVTIAVIT